MIQQRQLQPDQGLYAGQGDVQACLLYVSQGCEKALPPSRKQVQSPTGTLESFAAVSETRFFLFMLLVFTGQNYVL